MINRTAKNSKNSSWRTTLPPQSKLVTYDYAFSVSKFPLAVKPQVNGRQTSPGWHHHEGFYEIVLVVSGKGVHICGDKKYVLQPQEIVIIPPGMYHDYDPGSLCYYNVLVNFDRLMLPLFDLTNTVGFQNLFVLAPKSHFAQSGEPLRHVLSAADYDQALRLVKKLDELQQQQQPAYQMAMVGTFIEFLQLICHADAGNIKEHTASGHSQAISALAMELAKNCHRQWHLEKMCKVCGMSRSVLFREFKKYYNVSPMLFLNQQRLRKVCALLENSDKELEYIAGECGFANSSYLATAFKRAYNTTPLKYRQMHRH